QNDLDRARDILSAVRNYPSQNCGGQRAHDLEHEQDRILDQRARIELDERLSDRRHNNRRIKQRGRRHPLAQLRAFHDDNSEMSTQNRPPPARRSATGPSTSAGKNVSPPMIRITPTRSPTNRPPVVGNVPLEAATSFFCASEPAI